ncbi:MAG: AAA family ATPase [Deltaproteobacteria bacterium]|nr:AAA family ATPase [Deltaproteobacteria bacterium]
MGRDDRYCSRCGLPLEPGAPLKEHRFVTILFSDLSGYSALSERLDTEELKALMDRVLGEAGRIITSLGGMVEKFIGDAVVAMFGIHQTREDDPVRAIRAACEIHKAVGEIGRCCGLHHTPLRMHTGINTGEVLFDRCSPGISSRGPLGKPINIASRLSDIALPGEILIGESLVLHARRYYHLEWAGRKILKGFRTPLHVYRVVSGRKTPLPLHRDGGVVSPMVGRDHEISVLREKARELVAGHGGAVYVTGDAGIGKSRLVQEFRASLDEGTAFTCASCLDHARETPYFPVSEIVRQVLGLSQAGMDPPVRSGAIEMHEVKPEYRSSLSFLCGFSPFPEQRAPDEHKAEICDAVTALLQAASKSRPAIFCFEDIHWADQSTLDLLGYMSHAWGASFPCLLVLTGRTRTRLILPGTHIHVQELPDDQAARMLEGMLHAGAVNARTAQSLYDATGGNPFYLEEMVNYLLEKGVDLGRPPRGRIWEGLPATLQGLIGSRIDSLGGQSRKILQEASIIGRSFSGKLLEAVSSSPDAVTPCLEDLVKHGFINHSGESAYRFRHDLTREVAMRALLKGDRIAIHRKIALELERGGGSPGRECAEELAHHFESAREYSKAADYRMEAARRCRDMGSWFEAVAHYLLVQRSLEENPDIPEAQAKLIGVREGIWMCSRVFNPAQAIDALEALASHYRAAGLKRGEAYACIRLINLHSQKGRFGRAFQLFEYATLLAADDQVLLAAARTSVAYTYTFLGKPLCALELLEKARPALEASDPFLLAANMLTTLAACVWKGALDEARKWYEKIRESGGSHLDLDLMAEVWLAHISCLEGRFGEAHRIFREVLNSERKLGSLAGGLSYLRIQGSIYFLSRYLGDVQGARQDLALFDELGSDMQGSGAMAMLYQAWIAQEEGRAVEARNLLEAAVPDLMKGVANRVPYALNALAEACLLMGDLEEAKRTALACIEWNECHGNQDQLIWALRVWARISVSLGDPTTAQSALRRSCLLARMHRMRPHTAWNLTAWGDLLACSGKPGKARACYRRSLALWGEMGNRHQADRVRTLLHRLRA